MSSSVVRCETHALASTPATRADVARTIAAYRRAVRALCRLVMVHWPEIATARSRCQAVEFLFHITAKRRVVRYALLDRMIGKMPSYLRRAAIEHALGAVASFLSNWDNWIDGQVGSRQRTLGARAPRLGLSNVYPSPYGGNLVLYGRGLRTVQIKLLAARGQWRFSDQIPVKGQFKRVNPLAVRMGQSPSLIMRGAKVKLACPVAVRPPSCLANEAFVASDQRVCSIDVGINIAATAAIIDSTGTVIARRFLTCGRHNARRDALAGVIASRQSLSGRVCRGERHCVALHRRVEGLNLDAARQLASALAAFAAQHGAKAFVIEDLKGWRPKGPSRTQAITNCCRQKLRRCRENAVGTCRRLGTCSNHSRDLSPAGCARWVSSYGKPCQMPRPQRLSRGRGSIHSPASTCFTTHDGGKDRGTIVMSMLSSELL